MWGSSQKSGKPPPVPSNERPGTGTANPYASTAQTQELEQLRQRGLAKVLQKHLQSVCRKLANEQAAADAALADLASRKANMSDFQVSGELVGFEAMTLKATKWKAECRQKEKEALLLYQRYCDKFGKSNGSSSNNNNAAGTPSKEAYPSAPLSPESPALSAKLAAPPPYTPPVLPNIDEDLDINNLPDMLKEASVDGGLNQQVDTSEDQDFRQYYRDQTKSDGSDSSFEEALFLQADDNLSVVSGLTSVNSAMTKTIMPLVERDVQEFLQQEQSAIQELLTAEEADQRSANSSELDSVAKMAEQAESMAQQMQEMLQNFDTSKPETIDDAAQQPQKPRRVLDDNWVVYYDETFQREYYHHTVSGQSQWESPHAPPAADESTSSTTSHAIINHSDSTDSTSKVSRIALYRQRLRKKRRRQRRMFITLAIATLVAIGGFAWYTTQRQQKATERSLLQEAQTQKEARKKQQLQMQREEEERKKQETLRLEQEKQQQQRAQEAEELRRHRATEEEKARLEARKQKEAQQREKSSWKEKVAKAPKVAAHRAVAMDSYCAHVTPDSPLAALCL